MRRHRTAKGRAVCVVPPAGDNINAAAAIDHWTCLWATGGGSRRATLVTSLGIRRYDAQSCGLFGCCGALLFVGLGCWLRE